MLLACLALAAGPLRAAPADAVDALFTWATNGPGAAVAVIDHGAVVFEKCYGWADVERKLPLTERSAFDLASVSKQFTALGIMILGERRQLSYDDSLCKFFPEFSPFGCRITVRHLLHHTSGLADYEKIFRDSGRIRLDYPKAAREPSDTFEPTSRDALEFIAREKKLRFEPGAKWEYSDSGYVVLAQIIEKVSGQSYAQFLRENVFLPAGMSNTVVYDQARPAIPRRAVSYGRSGNSFKRIDYTPLNLIYGDGNVNTTLEDMIQWDRALSTEKLVRAGALREAFRAGTLNNGTEAHYGFGWNVGRKYGMDFQAHGGSWVGFRSEIVRFPERRFAVIILSNAAFAQPAMLADQIEALYLGQ